MIVTSLVKKYWKGIASIMLIFVIVALIVGAALAAFVDDMGVPVKSMTVLADTFFNSDEKKLDSYLKRYPIFIKGVDNKYYYNWFFPLAEGYEYSYIDSWGFPRYYKPNSDGSPRRHEGTDIISDEGIPIIAIESGTITGIGWNELGGWRISIKSDDGKRFWYYAHMRKEHPYRMGLKKGTKVDGGQVIGYVGSTGYSPNVKTNSMPDNPLAVDGKFASHVHIGIRMEDLGKWENPYKILLMIEGNKMSVTKDKDEFVESNSKSKLKFSLKNIKIPE